ncbi:MAG: dethiobiotin synthase [Dialister invisus]
MRGKEMGKSAVQRAVSIFICQGRERRNRMGRGLFITGTDTDVGKTYVTALLVKTLRSAGYDVGYYKAAISGARTVEESDAGFVNRFAQIREPEDMLLSYLYQNAVSPHLAARIEGNPVEKDVIMSAWERVTAAYPYVTMEGSGGIMCPIRHDEKAVYYLEDIIRWLRLPVLVIADAGLGTINRVVTTCEYIRRRNISVKGIILNHWKGGVMEEDNVEMIEEITGVKVLARVKKEIRHWISIRKQLYRCMNKEYLKLGKLGA